MIKVKNIALSDVVRQFGNALINQQKLSPQQSKSLLNIVQCRTSVLGGHEEVCDTCGAVSYSYNSCGDRHCPKCQLNKQLSWIEKLEKEVLPIKHYHVIFTLPHSLNDICLWNDKMYYSLMFKTVWATLRSFGYTHYGVESGAIAILHTWGQNLSLHPHIHCIVPAAGYSLNGKWKNIGKNNNKYLYPVKQLSATFKGKFLSGLTRQLKKQNISGFNSHIQKAYATDWVVYSEAPMSGTKQIIRYLGQYTHRIAISNDRILDISNDDVFFQAKDYRDNATIKNTRLKGVEFIRRFVQHILPKGFVRIRRYGVYHHTVKRNLGLQFTVEDSDFYTLVNSEKKIEEHKKKEETSTCLIDTHARTCPHCKKGKMLRRRELPRIRSPAANINAILKTYFL